MIVSFEQSTCGHSSRSITEHSSVRPLLFSTGLAAYFLRQPLSLRKADTFPRSVIPICAYAFRCLLWSCRLACACNTSWSFILPYFYSTTPTALFAHRCISATSSFRPVHSQIRQSPMGHSHHGHFVDPRPISSAVHLWAVFHGLTRLGCFQPTSPSFKHSAFPLTMLVGVSGKAFQSVTSSFHFSE